MTEVAEATAVSDTLADDIILYLQGLDVSGARLDLLGGGCHSKVYLCEEALPAFPQKVVVRIPECLEASRSIEVNATYLEDTSAPQILHIGSLGLRGTPIVIEEYVEGTHKDLDNLTLEEIYELAATVASVHDRTSSCFSNISGSAPICSGTYGDYLEAMVAESVTDRLRYINMEPYVEAEQLIAAGMQRLYDILREQPTLFNGSRFNLLHHDLNPQNMLWGQNSVVRLIDWNATFGDAADDIDYVITNNQLASPSREAFLNAYCSITGRDDAVARVGAYTIKNQLDDLVWVIGMRQRFTGDARYSDTAYEQRLRALQDTLAPGTK